MNGVVGINLNANASVTMTAKQYLEAIEKQQQTSIEWAVRWERERIIKLIEENMDHWDGWLDVKALIKGEQK